MSSLDADIQALVEKTTTALMKVITAGESPPAQKPKAGNAWPPPVAKEDRTLEKLANGCKPVKGAKQVRLSAGDAAKVDKAALSELGRNRKKGLTLVALWVLMPVTITRTAFAYRLRLLKAAGVIRQEGERKFARYLRVYAKG